VVDAANCRYLVLLLARGWAAAVIRTARPVRLHLQSLELIGFKSFAEKTVFEFHEGVTAIVGRTTENQCSMPFAGCWVSNRPALRGGEMADVIFNGTETRKPVGFGEVSLTFTIAGQLGVDWHDVRVTRRVYRDGNSEYLLNKTPCRLRDICLAIQVWDQRLFHYGTGQDRFDSQLAPGRSSCRFEEAGITKYKTQKREALRKLEATEANLLRIGDIIKEVKRQISSLQRQAGKRGDIRRCWRLQVLDTHHSHRQLNDLQSEAERGRAEVGRLEGTEERSCKNRDERKQLAAKRRHLDEVDSKIGDARAEVQRLQSEMAALRNRIDFNRQRAEELGGVVERYEAISPPPKQNEASRRHRSTRLMRSSREPISFSRRRENEVEQLTQTLHDGTERFEKEEELQSSISRSQNSKVNHDLRMMSRL
jgi:chromosome segregation protein